MTCCLQYILISTIKQRQQLCQGNDETRNGTQERNKEWNEEFFFRAQRAHGRACACNFTHSLGYGEMASSKGEETNPAVIDLTLQSASSASR